MGAGLEGVVAAETTLGHVDGAAGRLVIRGWSVEELARDWSFEEVVDLLQGPAPSGGPPTRPGPEGREALVRQLGQARVEAARALAQFQDRVLAGPAMKALASGIAALGYCESRAPVALVAEVGVLVAHWVAGRAGRPLLDPDPGRGHAEDLLRMAVGREPDPGSVGGLDGYLVAVVDHGMNASTFAARVVASTGADFRAAVLAGLGALEGPLHGGAPGPVLDMLDAIGTPERAGDWLEAELAGGRRLMGFGHRVYRVRDPRVAVLEGLARGLGRPEVARRLELAAVVEREAIRRLAIRKPDRPMGANVELATAVLLEGLGLPRESFTAWFAASRVAGWIAHAREEAATGRLIRPQSRYVGPPPRRMTA